MCVNKRAFRTAYFIFDFGFLIFESKKMLPLALTCERKLQKMSPSARAIDELKIRCYCDRRRPQRSHQRRLPLDGREESTRARSASPRRRGRGDRGTLSRV